MVPAHMLVKLNVHKLDNLTLMIEPNFFVYCHANKVFYHNCAPFLPDKFIRVSEVHRVQQLI